MDLSFYIKFNFIYRKWHRAFIAICNRKNNSRPSFCLRNLVNIHKKTFVPKFRKEGFCF